MRMPAEPFLLFIYHAIPARYAIEAASCLALPRDDPRSQPVLDYFDFHRDHFDRNVLILAAQVAAILALGFLVAGWRLTLRS